MGKRGRELLKAHSISKEVYLSERKKQGQILKKYRKFRNLTLIDLAKLSGICASYISRLESGQRRYNSDLLQKLSKALGCSSYDLLNIKNDVLKSKVSIHVPKKNLPVYETMFSDKKIGEYNYGLVNFNSVKQNVFRLPELIKSSSAFAVYIIQDFLNYKLGDLVFIDPEAAIYENANVFLITEDNLFMFCFIKEVCDDCFLINNDFKVYKKDFKNIYPVIGVIHNYENINGYKKIKAVY